MQPTTDEVTKFSLLNHYDTSLLLAFGIDDVADMRRIYDAVHDGVRTKAKTCAMVGRAISDEFLCLTTPLIISHDLSGYYQQHPLNGEKIRTLVYEPFFLSIARRYFAIALENDHPTLRLCIDNLTAEPTNAYLQARLHTVALETFFYAKFTQIID